MKQRKMTLSEVIEKVFRQENDEEKSEVNSRGIQVMRDNDMGMIQNIKELWKTLTINQNVVDDEEYENAQAELSEFLAANGESESRIAKLEKGLETHRKRAELQEELKTPVDTRKAVIKKKIKDSVEEMER